MKDQQLEKSLLTIKLEKDDIIYCIFKHPECNFEPSVYCAEIELKPAVCWFEKEKQRGKCAYTEFACYVFDQIYTLLAARELPFEDDCLLSTTANSPLIIYAYLKIVTADMTRSAFKMKLEWDGTNLQRLAFTIF